MEALKQAEIGLNFSPEYNNPKLNSIKTELLKILRDFKIAEEYAEELYYKNDDISGYHIIIRLLYEDYKKNYDKSILQNSLKICKKALILNPIDYNLLSLKFNIIKELEPGNHQYQHQILTQINKLQMKIPLHLRFRYAYLSFLLTYYPTSKKEFYALKELSIKINESTRKNIREWIKDEKGDKLKIQGEIDRIFSNKLGKIRILDLPGLDWLIPYSPLETNEKLIEGTPIWLNLGFSYVGPIAKNITRRI